MIVRGRAHVLGPDVNTDYIIASKYKAKTLDIDEMAKHVFEDLDPGLVARIRPGDVIVAGRNFGCGSSREAAPRVLRAAGITAILATSFARIFFRNSINLGLPVLPCETATIADGSEVEIDFDRGRVRDLTAGREVAAAPLHPVMLGILQDGGLAAHFRRHGGYALDARAADHAGA